MALMEIFLSIYYNATESSEYNLWLTCVIMIAIL